MSEVCRTGPVFIYPCAGRDIVEPVLAFGAQLDTFVFVDIWYQFGRFEMPALPGWHEVSGSVVLEGEPVDEMRSVVVGKRRYREISPAWRRSKYCHDETGRQIGLVFRRGFGQYALHELRDGSLGMFFHRGDSGGEGGSGVIYLGNRRMSHAPISMLMDVVKHKLAYPARIVSDGSNTSIRQLVAAGQGDESVTAFVSHGLHWERVGALSTRVGDSRHSVIWRVTSQPV